MHGTINLVKYPWPRSIRHNCCFGKRTCYKTAMEIFMCIPVYSTALSLREAFCRRQQSRKHKQVRGLRGSNCVISPEWDIVSQLSPRLRE